MNLPNFTAATHFVYTLQVNSSCSTPDPVIQFLNGDIGKCSLRFHRAVTAVNQRWGSRGRPWPREHILKSLALASKAKSLTLASSPRKLACPRLEDSSIF